MEPIIASDNLERAIVPQGAALPEEDEEEEASSSSSEHSEGDLPPGPVDPEKCTVGGPGTQGGSAQAPVSFHIQARDSRDKKLAEGGDYVVVKVIPGSTAKAAGAKDSEAIVKDNGDGSYTATYSVEARGDYQLTVEINGSAFGGSPFPVFFSPPDENATMDAAFTDAMGAPVDATTISAASDVPMPVISALGAAAYKANVKFPEDKDVLARTVIVGEMNPAVNIEQLQKLFSYSGQVQECSFVGSKNEFAFVTFGSTQEAEQALTLDKLLVIDRQIRVESAQSALDSKGQSGGTQYAALQLQQIQQLKKAQSEQHSLAAQVASMRVQAKQNPSAFAPGLPQNSASQKAAALSAIAALSRRLAGNAHAPVASKDPEISPLKRRREVSPTLRYRKDRRSRSHSRSRRRMSPPRRRSPVLILRRSPGRRRSSRERRRDSSRERRPRSPTFSRSRRGEERYRRSRSASRGRRGDERGSIRRRAERSRERGQDREDRHKRNYSRSPTQRRRHEDESSRRQGESPEARQRSRTPSKRRPDIEAEQHNGTGSPKAESKSPPDARNSSPNVGDAVAPEGPKRSSNDAEAQALREKALEALHSLRSVDSANGDDVGGEALPGQPEPGDERKKRRHKSKHHKHGKHKKEKRSRRDRDEDVVEPDVSKPDKIPDFSP